jgi:hypothetical protein
MHARAVENLTVVPDMPIGVIERPSQAAKLQCREFIAARRFYRVETVPRSGHGIRDRVS